MNILYLNHNFENEGTFHRCFFTGRELVRLGHSVTVLTVSAKAPQYWFKRKVRDGVVIITLPSNKRYKDYFWYVVRPFLATAYMLFCKYDIVHAFAVADILTALPVVVARICKQKPVFVDWDDWYSGDGIGRYRPFPLIMVPLTSFLEKKVPKVAKRVTAVSTFLVDKYKAIGYSPDSIFEVPNGCDTSGIQVLDRTACRRELHIPTDANVLMYIGWAHHSFKRLLTSFAALNSPGVLLYCVGEFSSSENDLGDISTVQSSSIVFTGYVSYSDLPKYLGAADAVLLPMDDTSVERARWPIRLGDYLAAGRLIVSNPVGEVGKILRDNECGKLVSTIDLICKGAVDVLDNTALVEAYEQRARKAALTDVSWAVAAQKMARVYE